MFISDGPLSESSCSGHIVLLPVLSCGSKKWIKDDESKSLQLHMYQLKIISPALSGYGVMTHFSCEDGFHYAHRTWKPNFSSKCSQGLFWDDHPANYASFAITMSLLLQIWLMWSSPTPYMCHLALTSRLICPMLWMQQQPGHWPCQWVPQAVRWALHLRSYICRTTDHSALTIHLPSLLPLVPSIALRLECCGMSWP